MNKSAPAVSVTVSQLPVTRCQICHRTVVHQPGKASEVLTEHYRRACPKRPGSLLCSRASEISVLSLCARPIPGDHARDAVGGWQHQSRDVAVSCCARARTDRSVRRIRISASFARSDRASRAIHDPAMLPSAGALPAQLVLPRSISAPGGLTAPEVKRCHPLSRCNSRARSLTKPRSRRSTTWTKVVLGVRVGCGPPKTAGMSDSSGRSLIRHRCRGGA
jgi:hypothetical protein